MDLSRELHDISNENLQKILQVGDLAVSQIGQDYALKFNGKLAGGGLFGAFAAYIGTNVVGGTLVLVGGLTAPAGFGLGLVAAGTAALASAPIVFAAALPTPTP